MSGHDIARSKNQIGRGQAIHGPLDSATTKVLGQDARYKDDENAKRRSSEPIDEILGCFTHRDRTVAKSLPKYRFEMPARFRVVRQDKPIGAGHAPDRER